MDFLPAAENFVYDDSEFYQAEPEFYQAEPEFYQAEPEFYQAEPEFYQTEPEFYQDVEYYQDVEHFQFLGMTFGTILVILAVGFLVYKWINRKPGDTLSTLESKFLKKGTAGGMYKPKRMYHNRQYDLDNHVLGDMELNHAL